MWPTATLHHNGHRMSISFFCDQGGALEEYFLWCHTCSPNGDTFVAKIDFEEWPLSTEAAVLNLFSNAISHSRYE